MSRQTTIELTNLCLIEKGDQIVVQERLYHGEIGYILPGGHIEEGESIIDSVIREVKEETGLTLHHVTPCGFKNWINKDGTRFLVLLFKSNDFEGELKSSNEGKVFYATREEFKKMNLLWNMKELLELMDGNGKYEIYYPEPDASKLIFK